MNHTFTVTYPITPDIWASTKEDIRMAQEKAADHKCPEDCEGLSKDQWHALHSFEGVPAPEPMSKAELRFLEEHNQAVIDWQREFSDAKPEKQREMLGWDRKPDEKTDPGINTEWISQTPLVRVLLEMPEEQALWLRTRLGEIRASGKGKMLGIDAGDGMLKGVDMYIREILIYG